jgi:hypothetical protein
MQATTAPQVSPSPAPGAPQALAPGTTPGVPTTADQVAALKSELQTVAPGVATLPGVPTTAAEVAALKSRRAELSNQLESAAGRRQRLSSSLAGKEGADRAGIEARIAVLDQRIMQLESDLAETGHQLVMAPGTLVATTQAAGQFGRMDPDGVAAITGVFILFVLAPIAFAAARMMWKRTTSRATAPQLPPDSSRRLERLEQGMDAIAVEIERISEGQRFVTRLLSEGRAAPALERSQRIDEPVRAAGEDVMGVQQART